MTREDVARIFASQCDGVNVFLSRDCFISVDDFLKIFVCKPTKEDMLEIDGGVKGYKDLIENGFFES